MKKTGFTLAEVLITLAIIGVVATMTLPALMTNTNEQQAKTGLKKVMNTLTLAAEMSSANMGFDFSSLGANSANSDEDDTLSMYGLLQKNTQIDVGKTNTSGRKGNGTGHHSTSNDNFVVFFRDGSSLEWVANKPTNAEEGFKAVIDINGNKAPNILSNCAGVVTTMASTDTDSGATDSVADCSNKSKRIIRDRFSVLLKEQYVQPNGNAARWTFNN